MAGRVVGPSEDPEESLDPPPKSDEIPDTIPFHALPSWSKNVGDVLLVSVDGEEPV